MLGFPPCPQGSSVISCVPPSPISFAFEENPFWIHWLFSLISNFVIPTPFMKVTEDFLPWNAVTSFQTLFDLSGSLETCAVLPASVTSLPPGPFWPLSLHLHKHPGCDFIFPHFVLSPEQSLLRSWVKSLVSAGRACLFSSVPACFLACLGCSPFHGHLEIKIAWACYPFPCHPNPQFFPLAVFY